MKEEQLDEWVREHYASVSMSDSKIANILKNTPAQEINNVVPFYRQGWFSYAAAACIALMLVSVVIFQANRRFDQLVPTELAHQVVQVHERHFQPDVYSNDLPSIQASLNHSDFSIIPTQMSALKNYEVVGGRNCGLKGLKAVHIVLTNHDTRQESCLYVLPDVEEFKKFRNALVDAGEGQVTLWHDDGRFFALYDPSSR